MQEEDCDDVVDGLAFTENSPDSLVSICSSYCVDHPETFCEYDNSSGDGGALKLRPGLSLPTAVCEMLLRSRLESREELDDQFLAAFSDPERMRLRRVCVRNCSSVSDDGLAVVLRHKLLELDISGCTSIGKWTLDHINANGSELLSLRIGNSVHIFPDSLSAPRRPSSSDGDDGDCAMTTPSDDPPPVLNTPNLRMLFIKDWCGPFEPGDLDLVMRPLSRLTHLDLSGCLYLSNPTYLSRLKHLVSLVLYNVHRMQDTIHYICQMTSLRHLDISQHGEKIGIFCHPNQVLSQIVKSLPNLSSLDISGTNLGGDCDSSDSKDDADAASDNGKSSETSASRSNSTSLVDIPGLRSRASRPLEFLGLLNTSSDACHRPKIPARKVTGDANERQILMAARAYIDRPEVLQKVLNDLFHIFRYETCHNLKLALTLILQAMQQHLSEKHLQISGSASLFYIVKGDEPTYLNIKIKRLIVKVLLDAMWEHKFDTTMMRNGCLTLCNFKIPQDVQFDYCRLVRIVLHVVSLDNQDEFVLRIGIYLMNSLACQVDGNQKQLVGELGAIKTMLQLIDGRLQRQICDEVMEIAWSTMWNVTDETPINCKRFLDGMGLEYFLHCLKAFPNKPELLRNMMGLLGNVAEVSYLRPSLMKPDYIRVFSDLLDSDGEGIEVSYNAAGVLSHIAYDGAQHWTIESPLRRDVLHRMVWAIERWDIATKRNINYRSFEPIFRLLEVDHTPESGPTHWAVWALANLTKVYPEKYCPLVQEEGGIQLLENLLKKDLPYWRIKELAQLVITHCNRFEKNGTLNDNLDDHDNEDRAADNEMRL